MQSPASAERTGPTVIDFGGDIGEVEFPASMSDADVQAAGRKLTGYKEPEQQKKAGLTTPGGLPMDAPAGYGGFLPTRETARKTLPMALGTAAALATGGLSLPIQIAAPAVAGALGSAMGDAGNDEPIDMLKAAGEGAWQAAPAAVGGMLKGMRSPLQKIGVKGWQFASGTGNKAAAREVLNKGRGALTARNLAKLEAPRTSSGGFASGRASEAARRVMRAGVDHAAASRVGTPSDILSGILGTGAALSGSPGLAGTLAVAKMASKPLPASYLSQGLFSSGKLARAASRPAQDLGRAALLARLLGQE